MRKSVVSSSKGAQPKASPPKAPPPKKGRAKTPAKGPAASPGSQKGQRRVPDAERKEKPIMMRVSPPAHEEYRKLSEKTGIAMSEPGRRATEEWYRRGGFLPGARIPILGTIQAGMAEEVHRMEGAVLEVDEAFAKGLHGDEYCLFVNGDSMTGARFDSIESGSYAVFRPGLEPAGRICHIEWPAPSGNDHVCTLKRLVLNEDGSFTLKPANVRHKALRKQRNEFVVKGVFIVTYRPQGAR